LDAGLAACLIHAQKEVPQDLTWDDWEGWLRKVEEDYAAGLWDRVLSVAFTQNGFTNPSLKGAARRAKVAEVFALARGQAPSPTENPEPLPPSGTACVFYPEQVAVVLAARDRVPMLTGRAVMNFTPDGRGYLPLSAQALGCFLGAIYTAPLISGRLLVLTTADGSSPLDLFQVMHHDYVLPFLSLARAGGRMEIKQPLSRIGEVLQKTAQNRKGAPRTFVAFWLSNSGQNPDVAIYRYVPGVEDFLREAHTARYRADWQVFVRSFWVGKRQKKTVAFPPQAYAQEGTAPIQNSNGVELPIPPEQSRNLFYEVLPRLPQEAPQVIRYFFKGYAFRRLKGLVQRAGVSKEEIFLTHQEPTYRPIGAILDLFVKYFVLHMTEKQIELIRGLAREIAQLVLSELEPKAVKEILGIGRTNVARYSEWRLLLKRLLYRGLEQEGKLLFSLDDYLSLFEKVEGYPEADWMLSRDLLQIALLEELYKEGYFSKNVSLLKSLAEEASEEETA